MITPGTNPKAIIPSISCLSFKYVVLRAFVALCEKPAVSLFFKKGKPWQT
jgi:hypothetical protein